MTPADLPARVEILVVGAGIGGLYAVHRFRALGVSVLALEAGSDVGGVWYHNSYPGARVDLESETFCYMFDDDLYADWVWSERYAAQPEIQAYLRHVAERFDLLRDIRFDTRVTGIEWDEAATEHIVTTDRGTLRATFVVAASGQLSAPRRPEFPGFEDFEGEYYQTSAWPKTPVDLAGKRVAVIGTGSSGVQVITALADEVGELHVLQRTPNYSVPAFNRPRDAVRHAYVTERMHDLRDAAFESAMGFIMPPDAGSAHDWNPIEREQLLEQRWALGGQMLLKTFSDQGLDWDVNAEVGDFVRQKVRERIGDRDDLSALIPDSYPVGTRRLCVDTGYYERFLEDHVHLHDLRTNALRRFVPRGIEFEDGSVVEIDAVVVALGFEAFTGALFGMQPVGRDGARLEEQWLRGPRTYLGVMAHDFPNLFFPTGPGGPSVLANMFAANVQAMDFIAGIIEVMRDRGKRTIWPALEAQNRWSEHVQEVARPLIRYQVDNYFLHRNEDGSKVYLPYTAGFGQYSRFCDEELANGLPSFEMA